MAAPKPANYFEKSKKGEVNELQQLLRNLKVQRDPERKREVVKKVRRTRTQLGAARAAAATPPFALHHLVTHIVCSPPPPPLPPRTRACCTSRQLTTMDRSLRI